MAQQYLPTSRIEAISSKHKVTAEVWASLDMDNSCIIMDKGRVEIDAADGMSEEDIDTQTLGLFNQNAMAVGSMYE